MLGIFGWANSVLARIVEDEQRSLLWGFDEPDTHLHYEAQYELLAQLKRLTEGPMQILICTHSIPIIDRLPATAVRQMVPQPDTQLTSIEYLTSSDEDVASFLESVGHGVGFSNSLLFYERCFIIVEGPTEEKALPILYRKVHGRSLIEDGIRLFAAESCSAVVGLARLLHLQRKNVVILLDADAQTSVAGSVARLGAVGYDVETRIVYVGNSEFEDAFSDECLLDCINQHYPRSDGREWLVGDIAPYRSNSGGKFSHDFLEVSVGREARKHVAKPEFGRKLAEGVDPALVPQAICQVFDLARADAGV
jgi:predicted ATP-dependent endonuclease of OLD family